MKRRSYALYALIPDDYGPFDNVRPISRHRKIEAGFRARDLARAKGIKCKLLHWPCSYETAPAWQLDCLDELLSPEDMMEPKPAT